MRLHTSVWLPIARERVFEFFSRAENLQVLTPDWLQFRILTPLPIEMRPGTIIDYRISLHGLPMKWRSAISTWEPPVRFVDEQLKGPYTRWVHTHRFTERDGGTLVDDTVEFDLFGGRLALWYVARDLRTIFAYRHLALTRTFGLPPGQPPAVEISAG